MKKRLAYLSTQYPPIKGGISDFDFALSRKWQEIKEIELITPSRINKKMSRPSDWTKNDFQQVSKICHEASQIFLSFTPRLFNQTFYGLSLPLIFWVLNQKITNKEVIIFAHEAHYPVELSVKGILLGIPQKIQFLILTLLSHKVIFSNQRIFNEWTFLKNRYYLPIFSNFETQLNSQNDSETINLAYFAGTHPSLNPEWIKEVFPHIKNEKINLHIFGRTEKKYFGEILNEEKVFFHGEVAPHKIEEILCKSDILLCPFEDGISARRGTLMTGLAYGKIIIGTEPLYPDQIPWDEFTIISKRKISSFLKVIKETIRNFDDYQYLKEKSYQYYISHLSQEQFLNKLTKILD